LTIEPQCRYPLLIRNQMEYTKLVTEKRIRRALEKVAKLATDDPAFLPVFERLERELAIVQAKNGALDRAKLLAAQSANGLSNLAA